MVSRLTTVVVCLDPSAHRRFENRQVDVDVKAQHPSGAQIMQPAANRRR
ncbi:MAG: hypothetical protein WAL63_05730 [Solirubrobacteraceae bacterium]